LNAPGFLSLTGQQKAGGGASLMSLNDLSFIPDLVFSEQIDEICDEFEQRLRDSAGAL
jgi:hypothetical protein